MNNNTLRENLHKIVNEQVSKCSLLYESNKKIIETEFRFPHESQHILRKLQGEKSVNKTSDYFFRSDRDHLRAQAIFKECISNGQFNPTKKYNLSDYYVKGRTFSELDLIFEILKEKDLKRTIIHIGEKGSGKTASQNVWLDHNNTKLEQAGVFWVRCDAHRLYRQWVKYLAQYDLETNDTPIPFDVIEKIASLEDYLKVQLTYVFCKNSQSANHTFIKGLANSIRDSSVMFEMPVSRHHENHTEPYLLIDAIEELSRTIQKEEFGESESFSYAVDHVLKLSSSTMQLEKRRWVAVANALTMHFRKNNIKILRIVDGVDNVHINSESSKHYYNHMVLYRYDEIPFNSSNRWLC